MSWSPMVSCDTFSAGYILLYGFISWCNITGITGLYWDGFVWPLCLNDASRVWEWEYRVKSLSCESRCVWTVRDAVHLLLHTMEEEMWFEFAHAPLDVHMCEFPFMPN